MEESGKFLPQGINAISIPGPQHRPCQPPAANQPPIRPFQPPIRSNSAPFRSFLARFRSFRPLFRPFRPFRSPIAHLSRSRSRYACAYATRMHARYVRACPLRACPLRACASRACLPGPSLSRRDDMSPYVTIRSLYQGRPPPRLPLPLGSARLGSALRSPLPAPRSLLPSMASGVFDELPNHSSYLQEFERKLSLTPCVRLARSYVVNATERTSGAGPLTFQPLRSSRRKVRSESNPPIRRESEGLERKERIPLDGSGNGPRLGEGRRNADPHGP